jgi:hypothetical protein
MTRWLMLPLLALMTACVSYYQPESALEDGVYYAEDDPDYRLNSDDFYYARAVVYPWSSIDSFYFGYWPYPSYSYGYWPYPSYGFSVVYPDEPGFAAGYYAFYSPWYWRGYSTFYAPAWRPYRYDCNHHGYCGERDNDNRDTGNDRYAADGGQNYTVPGDGVEQNAFYSSNVKNKMDRAGYPLTTRYAGNSSAQAGYRGTVARNNEPGRTTGNRRAKSVNSLSHGSTQVNQAALSAGSFSSPDSKSRSFSPPSYPVSSGYGKSTRRSDRD